MDIERTMTFIIEQQAKFETDIVKISESIAQNTESIAQNTESIARNTESIVRIHEELARVNEGIGGLLEVARLQGEHVGKLNEGMVTLAEAHNRLARTQERSDQRLSDFIAQVSRYLAGGNGRRRGPDAPGTE